jgi:hypothetical protein
MDWREWEKLTEEERIAILSDPAKRLTLLDGFVGEVSGVIDQAENFLKLARSNGTQH